MVELVRVANPRLQIVANRGQTLGQQADVGGDTTTRVESRYEFTVGPECSDLVLAFANFKIGSGTGEADGANAITVKAAIETDAAAGTISQSAAFYPLFFDGSLSRLVQPGAYSVLTDALGLDLAAGATAWVRTAAEITAGEFVPVGFGAHQGGSAEQAYKNSNAGAQIYATGGLAAGASGSTISYGYGPLAVLGRPKYAYPGVAIWGDSIPDGQGDDAAGDGLGNRGYAGRGLYAADVPYIKITRASDTPAQNKRSTSWRKRAMLQYSTHVIVTEGINQLIPTATDVQLAYLTDIWLSCKRRGLKVYQTLISCQTSSTDSWATTANQTINGTFAANRATVNAGIVAAYQAGLIDGYLDPGSVWEDPSNPGKFIPSATTDGTHPTAAYHILAAAVVEAYANANFF